jgi:hypothetical protein
MIMKVYVPYDSMQTYYLDAYTTWDAAQNALEDYVMSQFGPDEDDEMGYYLADECVIKVFEVK